MIRGNRIGVLLLLLLAGEFAVAQSPRSEKTLVVMLGTGTPLPIQRVLDQRRPSSRTTLHILLTLAPALCDVRLLRATRACELQSR